MKPLLWVGSWVLALSALAGLYFQHQRILRLEARLAELRDSGPSSSASDELAALTARVGQLERTVTWRAAAPQPAPQAPAAAAPAAPANTSAEVQQLREDVDALLTGEATATEQGKARLRALIAETQQQQWAERQAQRDERILQQLTENARLSSRQREDLGKTLEAERTQRRNLLANARSGQGNFEDVRPALQALRAQTDQKAREILDAEQYSQYTASRAAGRGPRERGAPARGQDAPAR